MPATRQNGISCQPEIGALVDAGNFGREETGHFEAKIGANGLGMGQKSRQMAQSTKADTNSVTGFRVNYFPANSLVYGHDAVIAAWVARNLPHVGEDGFGPSTAIGVMRGGELVAGVVFSGYRQSYQSIDASIYSTTPAWASRRMIVGILSYPFIQLACERVGATVESRNLRAQRFLKGIGFVREGVARRGFGYDHAAIFSMLRREFDRLVERVGHGQKGT